MLMEERSAFMADIMDEMESEVLAFIKKHVVSFARWDLIKFFHENPNTQDTAENLARYIGRRVEKVAEELGPMVAEGILSRSSQGGHSVYSLTREASTLAIIGRLVEASRDRTFRMKLVYHILRAGGNE